MISDIHVTLFENACFTNPMLNICQTMSLFGKSIILNWQLSYKRANPKLYFKMFLKNRISLVDKTWIGILYLLPE